MNCDTIDALLDEHRVASLSTAARGAMDAHLEHCRRCADAWLVQQTLAADVLLRSRPGLLPAALHRAAQHTAAARPPAAARWSTASAAGIAAVAALAAIVLLATIREPTAPPAELNAAIGDEGNRFLAGVHYERIAGTDTLVAADEPAVIEFFMYGCFPCFAFEPAVARWSADLPSGVRFERVPALFNPLARLHAQAFYTAAALGKLDELHGAMFEEIHRNGNSLASESALAAMFARAGVDRDTFVRTFQSAEVAQELERAAALNRRYGVRATPSLVIGGEHVTTPAMAQSYAEMLEIADHLLADRGAPCRRTSCDPNRR